MKIIVDITLDTDKFIEHKVRSGDYRDRSHFIEVAIANHISLERDNTEVAKTDTPSIASGVNKVLVASSSGTRLEPRRPDFSRQPKELEPGTLPHSDEQYWKPYEKNGRTPWIWGLANSVLAIKYCCRALAWIHDETGSPSIRFSPVDAGPRKDSLIPWRTDEINQMAEQAVALKAYLEYLDELFNTNRDSRYVRSFPKYEPGSLDRFVYHYVCSVRQQDGTVYAALPWLGFCVARNADKYEDLEIALTDSGRTFASSTNEVLDMHLSDRAPVACSEWEREFYLQNARDFCAPEHEAITTVARLVDSGHSSPDGLHSALQKERPDWNRNEVISYKGGALARMADLGLLGKEYAGRKVEYVLTVAGKELLQ